MGLTPSVLVIEGNRDIRDFIELALTDEGYHIEVAVDPASALGLIPDVKPDVILLDVFSPCGSNAAFMNAYHKLPDQHAPVILLTTHTQPDQLAASVSADGVLSKPFHLNDLIAMVTQFAQCPHAHKAL